MNFEPLLGEPILSCRQFDSIASDVWDVSTSTRDVIIRASTVENIEAAPWTWSCHNLFGVDVRHVENIKLINEALSGTSEFKIPRVVQTGVLGDKTYAVMEKLAGTPFRLRDQPSSFVEYFGTCLAHMHEVQFDYFGNIDGSITYAPSEFPARLANIMRELVRRYFLSEQQVLDRLEGILQEISSLPMPTSGTFVMLDMDERQYISDGQNICCVDTEGYAIGPCEFDLTAIEYSLDSRTAGPFIRGYSSVRPMPKLEYCRTVFRFLTRLMEIKGPADLASWMNYPHLLP